MEAQPAKRAQPPRVVFAQCVFSRGSAIPLQHIETEMTKPTSVASSVIFAALLSVAAIPGVAQPQHINCAYAAGCVEKMICDSPQLFNLDARMTRLYFHLQSLSSRRGAYEICSALRSRGSPSATPAAATRTVSFQCMNHELMRL